MLRETQPGQRAQATPNNPPDIAALSATSGLRGASPHAHERDPGGIQAL